MNDPTDIWRSRYIHPGEWDIVYPPMTLPQMFDASVVRNGAATMTDFLGARLTYAQIGAKAEQFAATLLSWGMAKGDRIGLYLPNVPDYLVAYYGALKAGAIIVNMSPLYSRDELAHQVADSGARVIVTADVPTMFGTAKALLDEGRIDRLIVGNLSGWLPLVKRWLFRRFRATEIAVVPKGDPRIIAVSAMNAVTTAWSMR